LIEMRLLSREVAELADTTLEYGLTRSSLLGTWVRRRMNALNTRRAELQNALQQVDASRATGSRDWQMLGPEFQGGAEEAVRLSAQCWFEGSLDLQRMCAARGIYYLHALQPTLIDPGSKPPSPEEQALPVSAQGWKPGVRYGYPLLRQLGAGLAEHGVAFVDLTSAFESVTESLYFDECHVLPPGNRILSERIADAFLARMPAPR
jgi:hypothetical protein